MCVCVCVFEISRIANITSELAAHAEILIRRSRGGNCGRGMLQRKHVSFNPSLARLSSIGVSAPSGI